MERLTPTVGDKDNESFEVIEPGLHHVAAGFQPAADTEPAEGHHRFPRRGNEEDIPRESLADRLRRGR